MNANNQTALGAPEAELAWELGDLLVHYLEKLAVEYVFGVPGGAIEPLYNALARSGRRGGPRAIVARHETGAAFMADGYSAQSGKLGVCCATSGPGATNLVTGVASAYANNVPILIITGQTALPGFGGGAFQESSCAGINTVGILDHCTLYSSLVSHADQFEQKLVTAIVTACAPRPGPAHLSVPLDIMRTLSPPQSKFDIVSLLKQPKLHDTEDIHTLLGILAHSESVAMVIGNGADEAIGSILTVAEHIGAQLVTTPHGKGLVNPYHPLFRGILGYGGHSSAVDMIRDPALDTIICIGTLMSERAGKSWLYQLKPHQKLIHIDGLDTNFSYTPMANLHIRGRVAAIFELLLSHPDSHLIRHKKPQPVAQKPFKRHFKLDDEASYTSADAPIKPQRLMRELPRIFPPNTCYLVDSGAGLAWALHYLHPLDRRLRGIRTSKGRLFRATVEFTSMGWAIGSAIGTALGRKGDPMVCITGDGSLLMSGQEITVAVQEQLPIVFVVLNDSCLGMVKHGQRLTGAEAIGNVMPPTDFTLLAQSMGAQAYTVRSPMDLMRLNGKALCTANRPTVIDVHIDPEAVPPLRNRIQTLTGELMSTESAEQNDKEAIHSSFWCEEAEPDNPFSAAVCRCAGFDVYGDLLGKANWIEYLYLLFHGEQPGGEQTGLLNDLAVAVANPGPRDHSVQAAMAAGAGGSTLASSLMAALAVGAGNLGGAREVYAALQCWERYKQDLSQWQQALSDWKKSPQTSVWPGLEHPPGFDPNGVSCPTPVLQTLDYLAANKIAANLKWLAKNRRELEATTAMPLAFSGVAAAAFADLHCDPQQGEMLYLLLRLPGAAAHALEQHWQGWRTYPFHRDGIKLDRAGPRRTITQNE